MREAFLPLELFPFQILSRAVCQSDRPAFFVERVGFQRFLPTKIRRSSDEEGLWSLDNGDNQKEVPRWQLLLMDWMSRGFKAWWRW